MYCQLLKMKLRFNRAWTGYQWTLKILLNAVILDIFEVNFIRKGSVEVKWCQLDRSATNGTRRPRIVGFEHNDIFFALCNKKVEIRP